MGNENCDCIENSKKNQDGKCEKPINEFTDRDMPDCERGTCGYGLGLIIQFYYWAYKFLSLWWNSFF